MSMLGHQLYGVTAGDHKFQAVSTLNQLEAYGLSRPTTLVKTTKRGGDPRQIEMKELREAVQRTFNSARIKRAEIYSAYIEEIECESKSGGTPAITLWMRELGTVDGNTLIVPFRTGSHPTMLIAVDGETQTEARFMLRERRPETGEHPVAVTVYHGVDEDFGQQILHDYNKFAKPIKESQLGAFSHTGPMSQSIEQALKIAGIDLSDINRNGAKPLKNKAQLFAHVQLMYAVTGLYMKGQALTNNGTRWFDELNAPTSDANLNGQISADLANMIKDARGIDDARFAHGLVWQCAGVKGPPKRGHLNWSAGVAAYDRTKAGGRGGARTPIAERLTAIHTAL